MGQLERKVAIVTGSAGGFGVLHNNAADLSSGFAQSSQFLGAPQ